MKVRITVPASLIAISLAVSALACGSIKLPGAPFTPTPIPPTSTPTPILPTPAPACELKCNIDTESYSFEITCESGTVTNEMSNSTSVEYDPTGQVSKAIVTVDQNQTYSSSGNTYHLVGTITAYLIAGYAEYDIEATGGVFGDTPQTCKSSAVGQANPTLPPTPIPVTSPTPIPYVLPTLGVGSAFVSENDGMTLVYVPEGQFLMGTSEEQKQILLSHDVPLEAIILEMPQHTVELDAFWIDKTEITNAQFRQFVNVTGYLTDAEKTDDRQVFDFTTNNWVNMSGVNWMHPQGPGSNLDGLENHPVVVVSWNDAFAYCNWAGRRLPTEAEWEKAARGTDQRDFPWGSQGPEGNLLNLADAELNTGWSFLDMDDGYRFTAPVGSYPDGASPYGALDMAGNVWEWVADWFGSYGAAIQTNPGGPLTGLERVERGGGWFNTVGQARTAARDKYNPGYSDFNGGFRCAMDAGR